MAQYRVNMQMLLLLSLCLVMCNLALSCCVQSVCSADSCNKEEKLIYHQTMTPSWLEAHASYIDSSRTVTADQLTFNAGSIRNAALLKVPMIAAGVCKDSTPLTVEITVANNVSIGQGPDSDIRYGV